MSHEVQAVKNNGLSQKTKTVIATTFAVAALTVYANQNLNTNAHANHSHGANEMCDGFAPENDFKIPVGMEADGGIDEVTFNNVIDTIAAEYEDDFKKRRAKFKVNKLWENETVNASANQEGRTRTWVINMYGGLARHQEVTADGFAMVVCHEIGHHLAGAPKKMFNRWASSEGQSDYFATTKCFRRTYKNDDNIGMMSDVEVPEIVTSKCKVSLAAIQGQAQYANELAMCQRMSLGALSVTRLLASLGTPVKMPKFETPDTSVVSRSDERHPVAQCRLDTYFQGALCRVSADIDFNDTDETIGACMDGEGSRPSCWFAKSSSTGTFANK